MSNVQTIVAQLRTLIAMANDTTGKSDADTTLAINSLIEGYGTGSGGDTPGTGPSTPSAPPVPILELPLRDSIAYTSTVPCNVFHSVGNNGVAPAFVDGAYAATSYNSVSVDFETALDKCTITFEFKINDNGLSLYPYYRRLIWCYDNRTALNKILGLEVAYASSRTNNKIACTKTFTDALNDGNWHTCIVRKAGLAVTCEIDGIYFDAFSAANKNLLAITFSNSSYSLNGYIKNVKIYDDVVYDFEGTSGGEVSQPDFIIPSEIHNEVGPTLQLDIVASNVDVNTIP